MIKANNRFEIPKLQPMFDRLLATIKRQTARFLAMSDLQANVLQDKIHIKSEFIISQPYICSYPPIPQQENTPSTQPITITITPSSTFAQPLFLLYPPQMVAPAANKNVLTN